MSSWILYHLTVYRLVGRVPPIYCVSERGQTVLTSSEQDLARREGGGTARFTLSLPMLTRPSCLKSHDLLSQLQGNQGEGYASLCPFSNYLAQALPVLGRPVVKAHPLPARHCPTSTFTQHLLPAWFLVYFQIYNKLVTSEYDWDVATEIFQGKARIWRQVLKFLSMEHKRHE